ncbi:MAG: NADPH-dependent F420 reductase [Nitrososphaerota archaeon]
MGRISIIGGTGELGFWLALRLARAGLEVVIGSRRREKAVEAAERGLQLIGKGHSLTGEVNTQAVRDSKMLFFSIPFQGLDKIVSDIKQSIRQDCIAVSCIVPLDEAGGVSAAEVLSSHLGNNATVVSALHTVGAERLAKLDEPVNCDTLVFGDSWEAKRRVAEILNRVTGLRPVDGGPLKNSRIGEQLVRILISINRRYGVSDAGILISGLSDGLVRERWGL